jgi:hypothetical protein
MATLFLCFLRSKWPLVCANDNQYIRAPAFFRLMVATHIARCQSNSLLAAREGHGPKVLLVRAVPTVAIPIKLLSFAKAGTARGDDPDPLSSGKLGHPRHHDDGTNFSKTSRSI